MTHERLLWHLRQFGTGCGAAATVIEHQVAEIAELEAKVARLPLSRDGVRIAPGDRVWRMEWPSLLGEHVLEVDWQNRLRLDGRGTMYGGDEVYSTRAAAEAAKEKTEENP